MINLTRQTTSLSSWRHIASFGLAVLFALLVNFVWTGPTHAQSSISMDQAQLHHGHPALHAGQRSSELCKHQSDRSTRAVSLAPEHTHGAQDGTDTKTSHRCQTCCPEDCRVNSHAIRRFEQDQEWLAVQAQRDRVIAPGFTSIAAISAPNQPQPSWAPSPVDDLNDARTQFARTIRLLV